MKELLSDPSAPHWSTAVLPPFLPLRLALQWLALYVQSYHQLRLAAGLLLPLRRWLVVRLLLPVVGGLFETEIVKFSVKNET